MNNYRIIHKQGIDDVSARHIINAIAMFLEWNDGVDHQDVIKVEKL